MALGLAALKALLGAWVLHVGFTHVSDDDYARVVIAQLFAHAPTLDPSGTSWLPFPFWMLGGVMMVAGRSLVVARAVALVTGCAGVAAVYLSLRKAGVERWCAAASVALAMATPWNAWLGVATVPEGLTGALVACGALLVMVPSARGWAALALLAASLSRYEAWPVCAVFATACVREAFLASSPLAKRRAAWCAAIALVGPALWMAWNAHAHDGALHFLRRVAAFRQRATGSASASPTLYASALAAGAPEIALAGLVGALGLVDADMRRRWTWPLASALAIVAFLVVGDWQGGAPTHHPERALVGAWWILAAFGVDGVRALSVRYAWGRPKREAWVAAGAMAAGLSWLSAVPERYGKAPGMGADEDRRGQILRGSELAGRDVTLDVTPCVYEHFAFIAGFGAPERVTVMPPVASEPCPLVVER